MVKKLLGDAFFASKIGNAFNFSNEIVFLNIYYFWNGQFYPNVEDGRV